MPRFSHLKFSFLFIVLLLGFAENSLAQISKITGKVKDAEGNPLQGVSVALTKGDKAVKGASTLPDGSYQISTSKNEGDLLVFSSIGFTTKQVAIGNSNTIDVTLQKNVQSMDEVIV